MPVCLNQFWLKPFLARGSRRSRATADCFGGVCVVLVWFCRVCSPVTDHDAQRMDAMSDSWVRIIKGPRPKSERWPYANRTSRSANHYPSRRDVQSGDPIFQPAAQKSAGESGEGSERRGVQVGGGSRRTWRREKCSRKTFAPFLENGQSPIESAPCSKKDGIMSKVFRTGQDTRDKDTKKKLVFFFEVEEAE